MKKLSPQQKKYILIGAFTLNFVFLLIAIAVIIKLVTAPYVSPSVLYLGAPLNAYTGYIKSIDKKSIVISQDHTDNYTFYAVPGTAVPLTPTKAPDIQLPKVLSYTVLFDKNTDVIIPLFPIPYHFKNVSSKGEAHGTIDDLKVGDYVTVSTKADLRLLRKNEFTATIVNVIKPNKNIRGAITQIDGNVIQVKNTQDNLIYTVTINTDTEISRFNVQKLDAQGMATPEKVSINDLVVGQFVNVYSEQSIENNQVNASLIEPEDLSRARNTTSRDAIPHLSPSPSPVKNGQSIKLP